MENRQKLQNIYECVKEIGLAKNQYDFSKLCGRTSAWFSCIKARNQPFTPAAALTLSHTLRMCADEMLEEQQYRQAIKLSEFLLNDTYCSIRKRHSDFLGCGL